MYDDEVCDVPIKSGAGGSAAKDGEYPNLFAS